MLKQRLIPVLLLKKGRMVKGVNFKAHVDVGHPVTTAKIYDAQGVDELVFLNIDGFLEADNGAILDIIKDTAQNCFVPLTVGGGVKTLQNIQACLNAGADKVSINTAAINDPEFLKTATQKYGSQCIVASVDIKQKGKDQYEVFSHSGTVATGLDAVAWCKQLNEYGVGEIMITSIDCEGKMQGYNLDLIKTIVGKVDIPVIASGGAGTLEHLEQGLRIEGLSAVAASSIFHFTDQSPIKARFYLSSRGLNVRRKF